MANILVVGNEGFLGDVLVGKLKRDNNLVVGLEKETNARRGLKNLPDIPVKGDVRDPNIVRRILIEYGITQVYHLACWPIVRDCSDDPLTTFDINVNGTVNLLEQARKYGRSLDRIVISTSDKAFGNAPVPYTEDSPLNPLFMYDTSKACQQLIGLTFAHNYGMPVKIVASGNFYGPGDLHLSRVIPKTITRLAQGKKAMLWEDSEDHVREFIYIDDAADAFISVGKKGKEGEVYCCGTNEYLTMRALMEKICVIMGKDPRKNIEVVGRPVSLMELKEQYLDSKKIRDLGWTPKTRLDEGLRETIPYYIELAKTISD